MPKDSHLRSFLKAFSWRIISTLVTICIAYLVTKDVNFAIAIGFIEFFSKFVIYYLHERAWQRSTIGKSYLANYQPPQV